MDMPDGFPGTDYLSRIINQIERLKGITGKLMSITRYETVEYLNGSKIIDFSHQRFYFSYINTATMIFCQMHAA